MSHSLRLLAKVVALLPIGFVLLVLGAWSTLVIYYATFPNETVRAAAAGVFVVGFLAAFVFVKKRWRTLKNLLRTHDSYAYELDWNFFENPEAWSDFSAALDRLRDMTSARGLCTVVLIHANLVALDDGHPLLRHYDRVMEAASERGLFVIQSFPYHTGRGPSDLWVSSKNTHPNAEGHRLLARALLDGLGELPDRCWTGRAQAALVNPSPGP